MKFYDFECTGMYVVNVASALLTQANDLFDRDCIESLPVHFLPHLQIFNWYGPVAIPNRPMSHPELADF